MDFVQTNAAGHVLRKFLKNIFKVKDCKLSSKSRIALIDIEIGDVIKITEKLTCVFSSYWNGEDTYELFPECKMKLPGAPRLFLARTSKLHFTPDTTLLVVDKKDPKIDIKRNRLVFVFKVLAPHPASGNCNKYRCSLVLEGSCNVPLSKININEMKLVSTEKSEKLLDIYAV